MKRFEYKTLTNRELLKQLNEKVEPEFFKNKEEEYKLAKESIFNELGEQGWELVTFSDAYIFKREISN